MSYKVQEGVVLSNTVSTRRPMQRACIIVGPQVTILEGQPTLTADVTPRDVDPSMLTRVSWTLVIILTQRCSIMLYIHLH